MILTALWIGLGVYAFGLAPPEQGDSLDLIVKLSTGQWDQVEPLIVVLFNLMGIWPMVYGAVLLADGRGQRVPAWPFVGASFGMGAFALLPYLVLRQAQVEVDAPPSRILRFWDARGLGVVLAGVAIALLSYGILQGNWHDFFLDWHHSKFINVMSLDFCCLCLLFPTILGDDLARRGLTRWSWWLLAAIPLLGPLMYLSIRPSLTTVEE